MQDHLTNGPVSEHVLLALRKIIQKIDLHSKDLKKRFGLTGPQLIILQEVCRGGAVSASQIARSISLSQATVTGILDRLEKRGLIDRRRSDTDRRKILVSATPEGESLLEAAPPLMQESFVEQFNRLQNWEQHLILSALQRMVALMDARQIPAAPLLTTESLGPSLDEPGPEPR